MPRAATSVATQTRARRSRSAWRAWLRSFWLCSPRQRHRREAALGQAGVEVADIVAGGAEEDRRLRLMIAQQVDHGIFDVGGGDGHGLIADVAMAALIADGGDAQRVLLVALGEHHDRLGPGGGAEDRKSVVEGKRV